jgi:apolipoprotein N-acyltransferase
MSKLHGVLLAALSGLLLVLSLPKPDLYPLGWIALAPLLFVIWRAPGWRAAAVASYAGGLVFFAGTFYWITETMMIYGEVDTPSAIGVGLSFCMAYALHFVLFGLGVRLAVQRFGVSGLFVAAPLWVSVELARTYWFSGFPWMLSGYALVPFAGLLQIVTWTGIYGLSFAGTAMSSLLAYAFARRSLRYVGGAAALAIALSLLPILPAAAPPAGEPLYVRLVQTNIALDQPWQEPQAAQLLDDLEKISTAPAGAVDLIVWPETPAPFYLKEDAEFRRRIQRIASASAAGVLVGYIDKVEDGPTNSAGLVNAAGEIVSRYDKRHLVPFGEYLPLKGFLGFADSLTRQVGDFRPGKSYTLSPLAGRRFSTAICYESIFPDLVREFVKRGSELLVVITNDGWFGQSSAPYQHLRMGVVRAVENRRYEVRTANTGITAIIDPYGRIENPTPIGRRMVLDGKAYFRSDQTFYTRHGDVFAWLNAAAAVATLGGAAIFRKGAISNVRRSH